MFVPSALLPAAVLSVITRLPALSILWGYLAASWATAQTDSSNYYQQAVAQLGRDEYDVAAEVLTKDIAIDSPLAGAWQLRGLINKDLEDMNRAVALDSNSLIVFSYHTRIRKALNDNAGAVADYYTIINK